MRACNAASKYDLHTAQSSKRGIIAITLTLIYLVILSSPLASLGLHSKTAAKALAGECSGDCNTCGCSAESMATRTCCCIKKQQQAHLHQDDHDGTPECGKKVSTGKKVVIASCGIPCGSGKHVALSGGGSFEVIPYHFTERFSASCTGTRFPILTVIQSSRHGDPPDPPPKISLRS